MARAYSGTALLAACAVAAPFSMSFPEPAAAQQIDVSALSACLVANTTDVHVNAMKRLMIAALRDDTASLEAEVTHYGTMIVMLATTKCGIDRSQLADPAVNEAVGLYGQKLGEKIMTDAFAKIGQTRLSPE